MAFSIYWLNLIVSVALCAGVIIAVVCPYCNINIIPSRMVFFVFIIICASSSAIRKVSDDEFLKKHFGYQFKTALFFVIIYVALLIIMNVMNLLDINSYTLITNFIFGLYITLFVFCVWFLYRNIKGLAYLSANKDL
jgi:uncharacterized membrane protein